MSEGTRTPEEIRDRIADHLGYCHVDGELHDPREFEEKFAGFRWACPDCDATVDRVEYHRASDLQWVLESPDYSESTRPEPESSNESETDSSEDGESETDLLENVQNVQENLTGDEDSTLEEEVESLSASEDET